MTRSHRLFPSFTLVGMIAGVVAVAACSSNKTAAQAPRSAEAVQAPPPAPPPAPEASAKPGPAVESTNLRVSNEIARLCNLPKTQYSPNFDFDSNSISAQDKDLLAAIAKCLSEGPLRGRRVALVGRADARGEAEYNMGLGGARADSVRRYLKDLGVEEARIGATSRGELDATGTDEAGYARDRRVDIELAN